MGCAPGRSSSQTTCWRALLPLLLLPAARGGSGGDGAAIHKYGDDPSTTHAPGPAWTYALAGDDWAGPSSSSSSGGGEPWACLSGRQQSPLALPASALSGRAATRGAPQHAARFELGVLRPNGSSGDVRVTNNGHTVMVSWPAANASSDSAGAGFAPRLSIAVKEGGPLLSLLSLAPGDSVRRVTALPQQFHFHTRSEHLLAGRLFPLEAHLVSRVAPEQLASCAPHGCTVVTAVLFELLGDEQEEQAAGGSSSSSSLLDVLAQALPTEEGVSVPLPAGIELDLQAELLPRDHSHAAYAGSLTTPPCSEGVLWLVMTTPQRVTLPQWRRFMTAVSDVNCTEVPAGGLGATQQQQQQQQQRRQQRRRQQQLAAPGGSDGSAAAGGSGGSAPAGGSGGSAPAGGSGGSAAARGAASPGRRELQAAHAAPVNNSSSSSSNNSGRTVHVRPADGAAAARNAPAGVSYRCSKLGGGSNARLPQPLNGRRIVLWLDGGDSGGGSSSGSGSGTAGAGVAAGAALGGSLGASLALVGCFVWWRVYSRRKAKRLLYGPSGSGDMLMVAQADDGEGVPWLGGGGGGGSVGSMPQRLSHRSLPL